jgi:hypothetical protein
MDLTAGDDEVEYDDHNCNRTVLVSVEPGAAS